MYGLVDSAVDSLAGTSLDADLTRTNFYTTSVYLTSNKSFDHLVTLGSTEIALRNVYEYVKNMRTYNNNI